MTENENFAFPHQDLEYDGGDQYTVIRNGLTKREYFAAMAMQGLLANPEWMKVYNKEKYLMQSEILAEVSTKSADALLNQLNKK